MKYFYLILIAFFTLTSCSKDDSNTSDDSLSNINNEYEIQFYASQGTGENHMKVEYDIDNNIINEDFNGFFTPRNTIKTIINESLTLNVELTEGLNYLKDFHVEIKRTFDNEIVYEADIQNPIFTVDALTHKETLDRAYNSNKDIDSFIGYVVKFNPNGQSSAKRYIYDFNQDIGIKKNTRSTLSILVDNKSTNSYSIGNLEAWGNYVGSSDDIFFDNQFFSKVHIGNQNFENEDRLFHYVIPQHITNINFNIGNGANSKTDFEIVLMRIDGTKEELKMELEDNYQNINWDL